MQTDTFCSPLKLTDTRSCILSPRWVSGRPQNLSKPNIINTIAAIKQGHNRYIVYCQLLLAVRWPLSWLKSIAVLQVALHQALTIVFKSWRAKAAGARLKIALKNNSQDGLAHQWLKRVSWQSL